MFGCLGKRKWLKQTGAMPRGRRLPRMNRPACLKQFCAWDLFFFQNGWSVAVLLGGIFKHQLLQAKFINGVLNLFVS